MPIPTETHDQAFAALSEKLSSCLLIIRENDYSSDYSGGSYYWERTTGIRLADGRYSFQIRTFSRVSAAGMSLPSENIEKDSGSWALTRSGGGALLKLQSDNGREPRVFAVRSGGSGVMFLDGAAWEHQIA